MKAFIGSLTVVFCILVFSIASGIYIEKQTDKMLRLEERLFDGESKTISSEALYELEKTVANGYNILTLLCHSDQPNRITLSLERLKSALDSGNQAEICLARTDFRESVKALRRSEEMSLGGII